VWLDILDQRFLQVVLYGIEKVWRAATSKIVVSRSFKGQDCGRTIEMTLPVSLGDFGGFPLGCRLVCGFERAAQPRAPLRWANSSAVMPDPVATEQFEGHWNDSMIF